MDVDNVEESGAGNPENGVKLKLSKEDIERLISQNSSRVTYKAKEDPRTKSEVWQNFKIVEVDQKLLEFVKCKCGSILAWKTANGTTALKRHFGMCGGVAQSAKIKVKVGAIPRSGSSTSQRPITDFVSKVVPAERINELNNEIVIGLAKDLRPLRTVEGKGFLRIAQSLINFGAVYGAQEVTKCIYHRTTLKSKNLSNVTAKKKAEIKELLLAAPHKNRFAFTMDMWGDKYKQRQYLSLSLHFIDRNWILRSLMLGVEEFHDDEKTTANVRSNCLKILAEYFEENELPNILALSHSVTDGGSNMISVFPNRYPCQCHRLNLAIQWTFNDKPAPDETKRLEMEKKGKPINPKKLFQLTSDCPKIKGALSGVKELVTYFKRSGLNTKLKNSLKQDVSTRWNSELIMLESYIKSSNDVKQVLLEANKLEKLVQIDDQIIMALVDFLKPFKECSDLLSGEKYPTFNLIALWYHKLKAHLAVHEDESDEMRRLKIQASICFEEYFEVKCIHYVACMLDPRYKKLKFATEEDRSKSHEFLQNLINVHSEALTGSGKIDVAIASSIQGSCEPKAKKSRFAEFLDSDDEQEADESELEKYLALRVNTSGMEGAEFDLLKFWSGATQFPVLQNIANWILSIPASQASDERVFSSTGLTITPRRTELSGSTLSSLTYLHKHY